MNLGDPCVSLGSWVYITRVNINKFKRREYIDGQMEVWATHSTPSLGKLSTWGRGSGNDDWINTVNLDIHRGIKQGERQISSNS